MMKLGKIEPDRIQLSVLCPQDVEETRWCLSKIFSQREPLAKQMQITVEEFYKFTEYFCENPEIQQLSLIAKDTLTNQIVGCCIVEDGVNDKSEDISMEISEKFVPIFTILEAVSKPLCRFHSASRKIAYIAMVAVDENYQSLGISKQFVALGLYLFRQKGYGWIQGEFTSASSLKAIQSVLVNDLLYFNEVEYNSFRYQNTFPFPITGKVVACLHPTEALKPDLEKWVKIQIKQNKVNLC